MLHFSKQVLVGIQRKVQLELRQRKLVHSKY